MTTMIEDDFDAMYGSKYLGVPDLKGQRPRRTIGKVEVAELKEKDGSTKRKRILYFEGEDKALVLNKTNAVKLAMAFGKRSADWVGGRVELYSEMTSLGKEGVRLQPLRTVAKTPPAPKVVPKPPVTDPIWTTKSRSEANWGPCLASAAHSQRQPKFKLARKMRAARAEPVALPLRRR